MGELGVGEEEVGGGTAGWEFELGDERRREEERVEAFAGGAEREEGVERKTREDAVEEVVRETAPDCRRHRRRRRWSWFSGHLLEFKELWGNSY